MNSVNIRYFALLREKAGTESEVLNFDGTHAELYQLLAEKYNFGLPHNMVQVAANDEFTSMNAKVVPGSSVVFIPPVAGG